VEFLRERLQFCDLVVAEKLQGVAEAEPDGAGSDSQCPQKFKHPDKDDHDEK
jgi:hypothetical protein